MDDMDNNIILPTTSLYLFVINIMYFLHKNITLLIYIIMFSNKNIQTYLLPFGLVLFASLFSNRVKQYFELDEDDDYSLVRKYLLNDFQLDGKKRPIIWIYSNYEINSRKWASFHSRNSKEINQPYLVECVQSVINNCGNDFNICLIDDKSFKKLLPKWNIDFSSFHGDNKQIYVKLGLMKLLYSYGGIILPNSFLCINNLDILHNYMLTQQIPFCFEQQNHSTNMLEFKNQPSFIPGSNVFGSPKENIHISKMIEYYESILKTQHMTSEHEFIGKLSHYMLKMKNNNELIVFDGDIVGIKNTDGKQIMIEDLLSESYVKFNPDMYGIHIPSEAILQRNKYNWFSVMDIKSILNSNLVIAKYFKISQGKNMNKDNSNVFVNSI